MNSVVARCLLCGKTYEVNQEHKDFKKLSDKSSVQNEVTFVCDLCNNRVRYESDEKQKAKKPM
jgi:uncharacterized protein YlaI